MDRDSIDKRLTYLEFVTEKLYKRFYPWWKILIYGTLHGVGATIGVAIVFFVLGAILSILGYFPVIGEIAQGLKDIINAIRMR